MHVFLEWRLDWTSKTFSKKLQDPNLIKYASNTFDLSLAKDSTFCLTDAKLKLQRTCFPVMCPCLDANNGKRSFVLPFG